MNSEAKTMTVGQALQLVAVIAQKLGKIGLTFDIAEMLISKPNITLRRLKALIGESPSSIVPQHQYATLERLNVDPSALHRHEDVGEYLRVDKRLADALARPDLLGAKRYFWSENRSVYRCDVVKNITEDEGLYPVFREVLMHNGGDDRIWNLLYKRHALWTIDEVLGFLRDDIHCGNDLLGLTESKEEVVFPVILSERRDQFNEHVTLPHKLGFLMVHQGAPLHQTRTWYVSLSEDNGSFEFVRKLIYFANDPRPKVVKG